MLRNRLSGILAGRSGLSGRRSRCRAVRSELRAEGPARLAGQRWGCRAAGRRGAAVGLRTVGLLTRNIRCRVVLLAA